MSIEIKVPDIGDFSGVPVIEIHVKPGDEVAADAPLITLESDKATMDVPAPQAGVVESVTVKLGDKVAQGSVIATFKGAGAEAPKPAPKAEAPKAEAPKAAPAPVPAPVAAPSQAPAAKAGEISAEVLVLGAGPGGYTAAFRAADLGKKVVMVERWPTLGGVCLNVGCIPSKALLHAARVISEAEEMAAHGVSFGAPAVDVDKLRGWKESVVSRLTGGLSGLAKGRKVQVVAGSGAFVDPHRLLVTAEDGSTQTIVFEQAIIAAGSEPVRLPFAPEDPRILDSTGALALESAPKRMLVIGGGIIGLEMATVYAALGTQITIVELMDQLIPGADRDLVEPLRKRMARKFENIFLKTKVAGIEATREGLVVKFEGAGAPERDVFDRILVAVGRKPNGKLIKAEAAGVAVDERGFIPVGRDQRTNVPHVFAIGDIVGQPMLAHKATHEAKVAAEVAAGHKSAFDARTIPSVAYTDPEIAWAGLTETEAKAKGIAYGKGVFPWAASGRALSLGRDEGITKVLFDEETQRILGAGIVGPNAGDLIAEAALAIEMGADARDIGLTVHPHPTLSETLAMAAEMFEGTITDLIPPKKKKH